MKIIQINAVYGVGSTGHIVKDIHEMLQCEGHESYVLWATSCNSADNPAYFFRIGSRFDHKTHALLRRIGKNQGWHSKFATKAACKIIKSLKPDVVHLHNLHSNYIHIPTLFQFFEKEKIRVLLTLHDCWFYTGYCTYYHKYNTCEQWQEGCLCCPAVSKMYRGQIRKIFNQKKRLSSSVEYLYCNGVSKWTTNDGMKSLILNPRESFCIYNWIDTEIFKVHSNRDEVCDKYNIPIGKKIILGVAQGWSNDKGLQEFRVISNYFASEAVVVLVGNRDNLQSTDTLKFIGYTKSQFELAELYSAADVFVNPSSFETFGLVTVEAMACGTPVVAYKNTGTMEVVAETCGLLVENKNINEMIAAIGNILSESKSSYSEDCVSHVLNNFNKKLQLNKYLTSYKKIAGEDID